MVEGTYIFDCEVFAHDWLFVFKEVATGEYTVIWNDNDEVLAFMERNPYLGGFNNKQSERLVQQQLFWWSKQRYFQYLCEQHD